MALKEMKAVGATAAATSALSCSTDDRTENEKSYFDAALTLLRSVVSFVEEEAVFEEVSNETLRDGRDGY